MNSEEKLKQQKGQMDTSIKQSIKIIKKVPTQRLKECDQLGFTGNVTPLHYESGSQFENKRPLQKGTFHSLSGYSGQKLTRFIN